MVAKSKEALTVENVDESFEFWASQPFIATDTRNAILKSNVLIVPLLEFRSLKAPVFPVCTEELFQFIKEKVPPEVKVEICIEEKDYRELALHGAMLIVGSFLVTSLVAPLMANVIGEYIKRRIFDQKDDKADVRVELTVVEPHGKALKFNYEGPASDFQKSIGAALESISKRPERLEGGKPTKRLRPK